MPCPLRIEFNTRDGEVFCAGWQVGGFDGSDGQIDIVLGFVYDFGQFIAAHSASSMMKGSKAIDILLQTPIEMLGDEIQIKTFNTPTAYLDFIETYVPHLETVPFLRGRKEADDYETINHLPVDINSSAHMQLPSHTERKNEISVLIIDCHLPEMNGLELCRI